VRALRRILPFVLAISLVFGFLSVRPPAVGAYNGVTYSSYAAVWYYDLVNNVWIEMQW
jgi:hypothetical protein